MHKGIKTYTMHEVETGRGTLTVYVDDDTKKVHHGVYHDDSTPCTLHPYESNPYENILDNCTDMYTWAQMNGKIERGTVVFK